MSIHALCFANTHTHTHKWYPSRYILSVDKMHWQHKGFFSIWLNCVVAWSLSHVQLFVTPWTAAHQASLSFTTSQSLFKFKSIELVMPSNHLVLCHLSSPSPPAFNLSQHQGLFQCVSSLNQVAKVLPHYYLWSFFFKKMYCFMHFVFLFFCYFHTFFYFLPSYFRKPCTSKMFINVF